MFDINAQLVINGVKGLKTTRQSIAKEFSNLNVPITLQISTKTIKSVNELNSSLTALSRDLNKVDGSAISASAALDRLAASVLKTKSAIASTSRVTKTTNEEIAKTVQVTKEATNQMESFGKAAAQSVRKYAAFTIVTGLFYGLGRSITESISAAFEFEREMFRLSQVTGLTIKQLSPLKNTINDLSRELGISANELIHVAKIFAQAGQTASEVQYSVEAIAKSSLTATFGDMEDTAEGLIAALSQFNIKASESEHVLSILNDVSKKFAVESEDLVSVIRRAGGVFATSTDGTKKPIEDLSELLALFTAVRSTTRESAETVATGLRTIFTRIQRGSTIRFLEQFNIQLAETGTNDFVGIYEAFQRLDKGLNDLIATGDDLKLSKVIEEIAGVRQISKIIPLIKSFAKAEEARQVALQAGVTLDEDVNIAQQSLSKAFERTEEKFNALIRRFSESREFQRLVRDGLALTDAILDLGEAIEPILPLLLSFATIKLTSGSFQFSKAFVSEFKTAQKAVENLANNTPGLSTDVKTGSKTEITAAALSSSVKPLVSEIRNLSRAINNNTAVLNKLFNTSLFKGGALENQGRAIRARTGARRGRRSGGSLYSSGGMTSSIPVALTPGELVFSPEATQRIGIGNLQYLNSTGDASVLSGMARTGIGVVPGSGNTDSFHTTLPEGSFVIRKAFSDTRFASNKIKKYQKGGEVGTNLDPYQLREADNEARINTISKLKTTYENLLSSLEYKVAVELGAFIESIKFDFNIPHKGQYDSAIKAIDLNPETGTVRTLKHEVAHAADNRLSPSRGPGSYSSELRGTLGNFLTTELKPIVRQSYMANPEFAKIYNDPSHQKHNLFVNHLDDYVLREREIFAELFATSSNKVQNILAATTDIYDGLVGIGKSVAAGEKLYGGLENNDVIKVFAKYQDRLEALARTNEPVSDEIKAKINSMLYNGINKDSAKNITALLDSTLPSTGTGVILHPTLSTPNSTSTGKYNGYYNGRQMQEPVPPRGLSGYRDDETPEDFRIQGPILPPGFVRPEKTPPQGTPAPTNSLSPSNIGALTALYFNIRTITEAAADGNATLSEMAAQIASMAFVVSQIDFQEIKGVFSSIKGSGVKGIGRLIKDNPLLSIVAGQGIGAAVGGITGSNAAGSFVGNTASATAGLMGIGAPAPLAATIGLGVGAVTSFDAYQRQESQKELERSLQNLAQSAEDSTSAIDRFESELAKGANNIKGIMEALRTAFERGVESSYDINSVIKTSLDKENTISSQISQAFSVLSNTLFSFREGETTSDKFSIAFDMLTGTGIGSDPLRNAQLAMLGFDTAPSETSTNRARQVAARFNDSESIKVRNTLNELNERLQVVAQNNAKIIAGVQLSGNAPQTGNFRTLAEDPELGILLQGIIKSDLSTAFNRLDIAANKKDITKTELSEGRGLLSLIATSNNIDGMLTAVEAFNEKFPKMAINITENGDILAAAIEIQTTKYIDNIETLSSSVSKLSNSLSYSLEEFSNSISAAGSRINGIGFGSADGNPFADISGNRQIIGLVSQGLANNFGFSNVQANETSTITKIAANEINILRDTVLALEGKLNPEDTTYFGDIEGKQFSAQSIEEAFKIALKNNNFTGDEIDNTLSGSLLQSVFQKISQDLSSRQGSGTIIESEYIRDILQKNISVLTPEIQLLIESQQSLFDAQSSYINALANAEEIINNIEEKRRDITLSSISSLQNFRNNLNSARGFENNASADLFERLNSIGSFTNTGNLLDTRRSLISQIDATKRNLGISETQSSDERALVRAGLSLDSMQSLESELGRLINSLNSVEQQAEILATDTSRLEETNRSLLKVQDERAASRLELARLASDPSALFEERRLRDSVTTLRSGGSISSRDAANLLANPQAINGILDGLGLAGNELIAASDELQAMISRDLLSGSLFSSLGEKYSVNRFGVAATTAGSTDFEKTEQARLESIIAETAEFQRTLINDSMTPAIDSLKISLIDLQNSFINATATFQENTRNVQNIISGQMFAGERLQTGGMIGGFGSGDKVPSLLEPGEFVLNRNAVAAIGANRLNNINNQYSRFQTGGQVRANRSSPSFNFEGLRPIMDKFYDAARKLSEVNIPSEITLNARVAPIEVIITGDVFKQMAPQLQNWIMNAVADTIKERFNVDGTLRDPSI